MVEKEVSTKLKKCRAPERSVMGENKTNKPYVACYFFCAACALFIVEASKSNGLQITPDSHQKAFQNGAEDNRRI